MKSKIATKQIEQAVAALFKNNTKESESDLLGSDTGYISLDVITDKIINRKSLNRKLIPLAHTPYMEDIEVCLFVKGDAEGLKEKAKDQGVNVVKEVITILDLKTKYKAYEARRKLAASYDLFLCDDRVTHLLPKIIGKSFIASGKTPVAIRIARGSLKTAVDKVMTSANYAPNEGTVNTIKVGNFAMSEKEVVANIVKAAPEFVTSAVKDWTHVVQVGIKAQGTPLLPIYAAVPKEEAKKEEEKEAKKEKKTATKKATPKKAESTEEKAPAVEKVEVTEKKAPAAKKAPAVKKVEVSEKKAAATKKAPAAEKKVAATKKAPVAEKKAAATKKAPVAEKKAPAATEKKAAATKKAPAAAEKKAPAAEKKAPATKKAPAEKKTTAAKKAPAAETKKAEAKPVAQKRKAVEAPADEKKPKTRAATKAIKKSTK